MTYVLITLVGKGLTNEEFLKTFLRFTEKQPYRVLRKGLMRLDDCYSNIHIHILLKCGKYGLLLPELQQPRISVAWHEFSGGLGLAYVHKVTDLEISLKALIGRCFGERLL